MHSQAKGARAHKARHAWITVVAVLQVAVTAPVAAQTAAAAKDAAPSEAARRAAESPYRFILQNASIRERPKPAPPPAAERETPKRPQPVEQAAMSAPLRPALQLAPAAVEAEPAPPAPAPASVAVAAPQAQPAPVVAVRKELVAIRQDAPELGPALLREQPSGLVIVAFDVNLDGSVTGARVTRSSNIKLNRPSLNAVQSWKFKPIDEVRQLEIELNFSN